MQQVTSDSADLAFSSKLILNKKEFQSSTKIVRKQGCGSIIGTLAEPHRKVLFYLYQNKGVVISKSILARVGWPSKSVTSASVLVAIYEIRRMLDCKCIHTIANEGYLLETDSYC